MVNFGQPRYQPFKSRFADDRIQYARFGIIAAKTARVPNLLQQYVGFQKQLGQFSSGPYMAIYQSFNLPSSVVHRIRIADFAREFCFCRNSREHRQANWGFAATGMEFQLQQPRRFRLWRVAENENPQLDTLLQHVFAVRGHKVYAMVLKSTRSSLSYLAVGVHYQKQVAVRTILVQPCTYAKVDLRL